ncbi:MAG: hypothetical protein D6705_09985 [Deltaproteobacteria bacterium]|nr:MAG: hypothetical protein D6705_09985 [Deltaproteobacteria bacterium]
MTALHLSTFTLALLTSTTAPAAPADKDAAPPAGKAANVEKAAPEKADSGSKAPATEDDAKTANAEDEASKAPEKTGKKAKKTPETRTRGAETATATGASANGEARPTRVAVTSVPTTSSEAPDPARASGGSKEKSGGNETNPWMPPDEEALMGKHPADFEGAHFKPGTGLVIKSKDGKFAIAPRLRVQFRYTLDNDNAADEIQHSFQIRRARLQFKGNVFGKHNKYKVEFAFSPRDLGFKNGNPTHTPILTWYLQFTQLRDLSVKIGQYKIPFNRQRVVSSGDLELVDRSLGNGEFNLDRDIGIEVYSKDVAGLGYLRYHAGVFMGEGRDQYQLTDFGMNYLARVEVLPMGGADGKWDYYEADFDRLRKPKLSLGVAYSFIDNAHKDRGIKGSTPTDGGTTDYHNLTADFVFKWAGFSASGEFYWREGKRNFGNATMTDSMGNEVPAPRIPTRDGLGYYVQLGYLVPRLPLGLAARWSQVFGLGAPNATSLPDGDEIRVGLSWYMARHPLKIQADYGRIRRDGYDVLNYAFNHQSWKDSTDEFRIQLQFAY